MTIALGILAYDSIVIATDTQIGVPDYLKTGRGKISFSTRGHFETGYTGSVAVAGAGGMAYLEHLHKNYNHYFTESSQPPSVEDFKTYVTEHLEQFYSKHVLPFTPPDRPDVWLLLGFRDGKNTKLWSTEKNLVTECGTYAAVGAGAMYANVLLSRLFLPMWPMTARTAILLAAFVLFQVKDCIDGCGRETDIVCVNDSGANFVNRTMVKELEKLFESYLAIETTLLHDFLAAKESPKSTSPTLRKLKRELDELLQSSPITSSIDQT